LTYGWRDSGTSFSDIGGYYDLKDALHEDVLEPLRAAQRGDDRYSRFGIEPERGILLYGPPGTGKTMFARALAGELDIPFVELSPADVTSMWVNESSDQVKTLFSEADEIGQCIIFLDEAEHLFGAREHTAKSAHAEDRKVTSEFLAQLTRDDREAIVVSATNRPGDIDRAILRPGRLTAHFEVGLPDEEARHAILKTHLEDIPSAVSGDEFAALARHTGGLTGADLANLVGQARRSAAHRNARAVTRDDFPSEDALEELSAELAAENGTDELPDTDADLDAETAPLPEAKGGVRADDDESDFGDDGPTRGYQ
jgi:SpoVK/Ycf46/Vps4 family AAA+-type ATPase